MDRLKTSDVGGAVLAAALCCFATGALAQPRADDSAAVPQCKDLKLPGPDLTIPVDLGPQERFLPKTGVETHAAAGAVMMRRDLRVMTDLVTSISGPFTFRGGKGQNTFDVIVPAAPLVPFKNEVQEVYVSPGARVDYGPRTGPQPIGIYFLVPIDDRTKLISHIYWGNAAEDHVIGDARIGHTVCAAAGAPGMTQELVYSSISGSTVSLLYREFADEADRAGPGQILTHDLAASDQITVKGAVIKVIKATDAAIAFVVEKPFAAN